MLGSKYLIFSINFSSTSAKKTDQTFEKALQRSNPVLKRTLTVTLSEEFNPLTLEIYEYESQQNKKN